MRTKLRTTTALMALIVISVTSLMSSLDAAAVVITASGETTTTNERTVQTSPQQPTQQLCAEEVHFSDCYLCAKMADSSRIYNECCAGLVPIVNFCMHLVHSVPPPPTVPASLPPPGPVTPVIADRSVVVEDSAISAHVATN